MYTMAPRAGKNNNYNFDKQRTILRQGGFVWCVYLMAYKHKSKKLYEKIKNLNFIVKVLFLTMYDLE